MSQPRPPEQQILLPASPPVGPAAQRGEAGSDGPEAGPVGSDGRRGGARPEGGAAGHEAEEEGGGEAEVSVFTHLTSHTQADMMRGCNLFL